MPFTFSSVQNLHFLLKSFKTYYVLYSISTTSTDKCITTICAHYLTYRQIGSVNVCVKPSRARCLVHKYEQLLQFLI